MKEAFIERKFSAGSLAIIEQADAIIRDYQRQGFSLTLRQLYYQFVARDIIPNKQSEYKRLGSIVNDARLAGLLDWSAIEDRTRTLRGHGSWGSPASIIQGCAAGYAEDLWEDQAVYVEIWIEKDALIGVIEPVCDRLRLPYFACRGYASQSELYRAGKRMADRVSDGKTVKVFHLGDHDPSGLDMTRDNEKRLLMFAEEHIFVERLALNFDQIRRYKPPPNPAKETDSRIEGYRREYGTSSSWELDALEPRVIDRLIQDAVDEVIDADAWAAAIEKEEAGKAQLQAVADNWEDIIRNL